MLKSMHPSLCVSMAVGGEVIARCFSSIRSWNTCSTRSRHLALDCMLKSRVQPAGHVVRNPICCRNPYDILEASLAHKAFFHTAVPLCMCSKAEDQPESAESHTSTQICYLPLRGVKTEETCRRIA